MIRPKKALEVESLRGGPALVHSTPAAATGGRAVESRKGALLRVSRQKARREAEGNKALVSSVPPKKRPNEIFTGKPSSYSSPHADVFLPCTQGLLLIERSNHEAEKATSGSRTSSLANTIVSSPPGTHPLGAVPRELDEDQSSRQRRALGVAQNREDAQARQQPQVWQTLLEVIKGPIFWHNPTGLGETKGLV